MSSKYVKIAQCHELGVEVDVSADFYQCKVKHTHNKTFSMRVMNLKMGRKQQKVVNEHMTNFNRMRCLRLHARIFTFGMNPILNLLFP